MASFLESMRSASRFDRVCSVSAAGNGYIVAPMNASRVCAGARGIAIYPFKGREVTAHWEVRQNAVWRHGRAFFRCSRCSRLCTRLYLPLPESSLACRRCFGLTYASRTLSNYKASLWGRGMFARMFGTSQRDWAYQATADRRRERWEASLERWKERRDARKDIGRTP